MAVDRTRWLTRDSPGRSGDPEMWIDAGAMDSRGGLDPAVAEAVHGDSGGGVLVGMLVRFPGWDVPDATYLVVSRRTSRANLGRPYYVLKRQDREGLR